MPTKPSGNPIPEQRSQTVRQAILDALADESYDARELSRIVRKSEKEIYEHLEHLTKAGTVRMTPANCVQCGYVFEQRHRSKKPGKCPRCKSTRIEPPLFTALK